MKNIKQLGILIGLLVAIFSVKFLIPQVLKTYDTYNQLKQDQEELKKLQTKRSSLQNLNEADLQQKNNLALKVLPSEKNLVLIVSSLETLANENGVFVDSIRVLSGTATASAGPVNQFEFSLRILGDIGKITEFMTKVKSSLPLSEATGITIDSTFGGADIKIKSYFSALPKTIGKVDAAVNVLTAPEEELLSNFSTFSSTDIIDMPTGEFSGGKTNPFEE